MKAATTPRKGINVAFKHTSGAEFEKPAQVIPRSAAYIQNALVKRRLEQRGLSSIEAYAKKAATYNGAELKPYQGRPGSLDFLALPSLIGLKRIYRADQSTNAESTL